MEFSPSAIPLIIKPPQVFVFPHDIQGQFHMAPAIAVADEHLHVLAGPFHAERRLGEAGGHGKEIDNHFYRSNYIILGFDMAK